MTLTGRILEGIVTTCDPDGQVHLAPMGPIVNEEMTVFRLRPYQTSTTFQNLKRTGQGVFHVTDDVNLLGRAAVGKLTEMPQVRPAEQITGWILEDACRWYEFQVTSLDDSQQRTEIMVEVISQGRGRDFFGFNRAMHAVLEGAILATRIEFLPPDFLLAEFKRLAVQVEKTAGRRETEAFEFLHTYLKNEIADLPEPAGGEKPGAPR